MERLILCGAGHVSLELAHIASRLDFEIVVIDDRPEFASRDRFPMAGQVVCAPFLEALDALGSRESDYYVILTRGHAHDRDCLEHVLRGKYAYAGMIGSRTKVAAVKAALEAAGIRALMEECGYTQELAAKRVGRSRPAVANLLRLLQLPESIRELVKAGELSAGHARVLAGLAD